MVAGHLQQKKGYWYMVLNLYADNGKRKSTWIATHLPVRGNKRRAEELLLQTRQRYNRPGKSGTMLFADYMLQWLNTIKPRVSPTTYHGYKYNIERSICPYFRERQLTLSGLRSTDLEQYYAHLCQRGLSPNTALHHHANLHKALQDAVRADLIDRNVADIAQRPKKDVYIPDYCSADEVNQLLDKLRSHWLRLPVTLTLFYGLRRSEALGLQWRSIDFDNGTLIIQHTRVYQEVDGKEIAVGKDTLKRQSSYRTLPMPEQIYAMLVTERTLQYADAPPSPDAYVCLNKDGRPIPPNYFTQSFKQFLRENRLREVPLHGLRHTCASLLIQNRTPLIEVQQWLGHSTLETTANLYAHLEYETKLNSAETLKKI